MALSNSQAVCLARQMTERQQLLLLTVRELRFVTGGQLARVFFDDGESTGESAKRMARRELQRLTGVRVIDRLARRVGGSSSGSDGFIYRVGPLGRRLTEMLSGEGLPRSRSYEEPGEAFVTHTLATAEVYVRLKESERADQVRVVEAAGEPRCWRPFVNPTGAATHLKPDLYLVTSQGEFEDSWFVEVDLATERRAAITRKLGELLHLLSIRGRAGP
ncbi:MAG: replication-relaxation family protein [Solirubrobacterales bacterium]|nr:replication-relaxation family protein [Solirubrobacterales bacterium]